MNSISISDSSKDPKVKKSSQAKLYLCYTEHLLYFFSSIFKNSLKINIKSLKSQRHMNIPGLWMNPESSSIDRLFKVNSDFGISVGIGLKHLTILDEFPCFSFESIGDFDSLNPLIGVCSALNDDSCPQFGLFLTDLDPLPYRKRFGSPTVIYGKRVIKNVVGMIVIIGAGVVDWCS